MKYRELGSIGWKISEISFGAWAIGGSWGKQSDEESMATLHRAVDLGVNFIDTADVYGDGRSERLDWATASRAFGTALCRHQGGPAAESSHG